MSVQYRVMFKDGKSFRAQGICFGKMGVNRWHEQRLINPDRPTQMFTPVEASNIRERDGHQQKYIDFEVEYGISHMWSAPMDTHSDGEYPEEFYRIESQQSRIKYMLDTCGPNYFSEMKLLLEELPMYKSWVKVHPKLGVIRFHIGKRKADEVMLAMSLFRNLCNYGGFVTAYKEALHCGYTRRFAAIIAHFFNITVNKSAFSGKVDKYYQPIRTGEYNWFSPDTIGSQGLINLLNQNVDKFDYVQDTWKNQRGYYRDSHFKSLEVVFDDRYKGIYWNWRTNSRDVARERDTFGDIDTDHSNSIRYRKMVDAFSIAGDEVIPGVQEWNSVVGFYIAGPTSGSQDCPYSPVHSAMNKRDAEAAIAALAAFAEANGYNPKY